MNTALDPGQISSQQLTQADNVIYDTRSTKRKREGINSNWDDATTGSDSVIGMLDFHWGVTGGKTNRIVAVHDTGAVYSYEKDGTRSADLFGGTAWGSAVTTCSMETMNNLAIIAVDGSSNVVKKWNGTGNIADLGGTPPEASLVGQHLGRIWCNDKTNVDRLHYSTTQNPEEWNGTGDSGALDIGLGDGDPDGITAIFPTFKGDLFVAKRTKLYRISGFTPETFQISLVSSGIGCISHNSITPVDQSDVFFVSERGVHSLAATSSFGDFESKFVSFDIQATFNKEWTFSRLKFIWGAYVPEANSVAFAVTDETVGTGSNNTVWLYNIPNRAWYRWPDVACESLIVANDTDAKRLYFGGATSRISQGFTGSLDDTDTSGNAKAIEMTLKTGVIYPDNQVYTVKGFKTFALIYTPKNVHTITVRVKIDNLSQQSVAFSDSGASDLLGTSFILGTSELGFSVVLAPYHRSIDGYGRGFQLTMTQSGCNEDVVDIQGFALEYEPAASAKDTELTE